MALNRPIIGFVGLGEMGGPMVANLLAAGYTVYGYDLDAARLAAAADAGATPAASVRELVAAVQVIATSLPSSEAWITVAEQQILPHAAPGQTLIDFGTVTPPAVRRLAAAFAARGVDLVDCPVSGGPGGVCARRLYMFAGGDATAVDRCRPILEAVGGAERIACCGPAGGGQVVKGVNQLMMGLVDAAYVEAIAFGVNAGVDIAVIAQAIGHEGRWRSDFSALARRIVAGEGNAIGVKFRELPYFLEAAAAQGFDLPITRAVCERLADAERVAVDDHRPAPSYWHELTK